MPPGRVNNVTFTFSKKLEHEMILITNKSMTRVCKYIFVLVLLFTFVNNAFASVVTVTPPTATSASGGDIGNSIPYNYLGTYDPAYTSLTFTPTSDFNIPR